MVGRSPGLARITKEWADVQRGVFGAGSSKLILVELAVATARLADRARIDQDQRSFLAAASRLQQLITAVERDRDSGAADSGDDAWSRELAEVLGSGPTMGNVADG